MDIGDKLGNYKLLEKLGEGGMAVIYKALDTSLHHEVVIKFPKDQFAKDPKYLKIFEEEGRKLAKLRSPYILAVVTADYKHSPPYVVLEYLEGKSLEEILDVMGIHDRGVLPEEKALEIVRKVAEGLESAHREGIIHCDINPANIMLSYNDKVTIMDFGIAQSTAEKNGKKATVVGNPGYMAPEQIEGKEVDPRSDIYCLGGVFFEMVTSRTPFESDSIDEMLNKALNNPPPNPRGFNRNLSPKSAALILKMLEKDPDKRYQSMQEVIDDILEVKKSRSAMDEDKKMTARKMYLFLGSLIILGVTIIGMSLFMYQQSLKRAKESTFISPAPPDGGHS
ncbi:serine/threonine protein kinase [Candidatus Margulisiibacteriota bacterium]